MTRITNGSTYFLAIWNNTRTHVTERKINDFQRLEAGWHYGEGVPFSATLLVSAKLLNQKAVSLPFFETDAFPGVNGEVMVTVYHSDHYLEFTIEPDGRVNFYREKGNEEVSSRDGLSLEQAEELLHEFREEVWKESVLYTGDTMITESADLSALLSKIQATHPESLLLAESASLPWEMLSAGISESIMDQSQAILQYSGASRPKHYLVATG